AGEGAPEMRIHERFEPRSLANFVAGQPVPPQGGEYLDDVAPATGEVIARVPRSAPADVDAAVAAAHEACERWARSPVSERADLCEAVARAIERRADELAELESLDTGKPL